MKVGVIGRSEMLYESALRVRDEGHQISFIITAREAPEYSKTAHDFEELAKLWRVPFVKSGAIGGSEAQALFEVAETPDVAISMNYPTVIPQNQINRFRLGILNAHGGDLPRYRGNACQAWAIINGEKHMGVCVHKMVGGVVDAGDIITRDYIRIGTETRVGELLDGMKDRLPTLFVNALASLGRDCNFRLEAQPMCGEDVLRCYPRRPEDGRIDWGRSEQEIVRLVNASSEPYSGAFCTYGVRALRVWRAASANDHERFLSVPGQVARIDASTGEVTVCCGRGKVRLQEIEIDDRRMIPANLILSPRDRLT